MTSEIPLTQILNRKHVVATVDVHDTQPLSNYTVGYSLSFRGEKLDAKDGINDKSGNVTLIPLSVT